MRIVDIPEFKDKSEVFTMSQDRPLTEAVQHMCSMNYGSVVVTDKQGKLTGIVTERDLMIRVLNEGKDFANLKLEDIMTRDPKTAKEDDLVSDTLRRMSQGHFRHMPIIDNENNIVGLVSQGDFVAYTWPQIMHRLSESAQDTITSRYQPILLALGVMLYTFFLLSAF